MDGADYMEIDGATAKTLKKNTKISVQNKTAGKILSINA